MNKIFLSYKELKKLLFFLIIFFIFIYIHHLNKCFICEKKIKKIADEIEVNIKKISYLKNKIIEIENNYYLDIKNLEKLKKEDLIEL